VFVDDVDIAEKRGVVFSDVSVQLSIDSSASSCSFTVIGEYEFRNTAFSKNNLTQLLQIGARINVEIGYIVTENVFRGLIMELEYVMEENEAPSIRVECMDAKCLLMKRQVPELNQRRRITDVINDMFRQNPFNTYIRRINIEPFGDPHDMITSGNEDNYQFITKNAQEMGYEFYILQGNVHFRRSTRGSSQSPIMTLSPEFGLRSFRMTLRGSPLYNSVTVIGMNPRNNQRIRERVNISPNVRRYTNRILPGADKTERDYSINTSRRARDKATTQMSGAQNEFRSLSGSCIGIPELGPGRNIRIEGVSPEGDRVFYLTSVSHSLDNNGFTTNWEARVNV